VTSEIVLGELKADSLPEAVPYAVIMPPGSAAAVPLCLLLMGGGGSRQSLLDCQKLFDAWWSDGTLAPMAIATPSAAMSYYLDDPEYDVRWDTFLAVDLVARLRSTLNVAGVTAIAGISMGGYGALKVAFARPEIFRAAAAMQPMLDPGLSDSVIGARNRLHHASGGPARLIGPGRDPALFEANNPANRARANAKSIRESNLATYIDAADNDMVNAHDGAEFLHRVLWDLDISHEYHLVRNADHGGPTFIPRMRAMFGWLSGVLGEGQEPAAKGDPASPTSNEFLRMVRAQLQPLRDQAAATDPATHRRYGVIRN